MPVYPRAHAATLIHDYFIRIGNDFRILFCFFENSSSNGMLREFFRYPDKSPKIGRSDTFRNMRLRKTKISVRECSGLVEHDDLYFRKRVGPFSPFHNKPLLCRAPKTCGDGKRDRNSDVVGANDKEECDYHRDIVCQKIGGDTGHEDNRKEHPCEAIS